MNHSTVNIVDLSDEMLLATMKKLNNVDILYSFIGLNQQFDRLAQETTFTQSIDFTTILLNVKNKRKIKSILDRFSFEIIPRIQHHIRTLTLDRLSVDHGLHMGNYPKLWKIILTNLSVETTYEIFNDKSPFISMFKHQILHLMVKIDNVKIPETKDLPTNSFVHISTLLTNLYHLEFEFEATFIYSSFSLTNLSTKIFFSLNLRYLNIMVQDFEDFLCLFDGRFTQLHTVIVKVDSIKASPMTNYNTKIVSNLKCFTLICFKSTAVYDNQISPLLREMSQLEKLALSLVVIFRTTLIHVSHLNNCILKNMPNLQSFTFDIVNNFVKMKKELLPICGDIEEIFLAIRYHMNCYLDYNESAEQVRCHIYSLPYTMDRMQTITNNFPGGYFVNVRRLHIMDGCDPFEPHFFVRISLSFPFINCLEIFNMNAQKKKFKQQPDGSDQRSLIIFFSYLVELSFNILGHIDYVENFLLNQNMALPRLTKLHIDYKQLRTVTNKFKSEDARAKCAKLKHITFEKGTARETLSKSFLAYFPSLKAHGLKDLKTYTELAQFYHQLNSPIDFIIIYIREAHASDGWKFDGPHYSLVANHRNIKDRLDATKIMIEMSKITQENQISVYADTMDDHTNHLFRGFPERLYVLYDQKILYQGQNGPVEYSIPSVDYF